MGVGRVSKSCNHVITQFCTMSENLRKIWANEHKIGKTGINFMFLSQFYHFFMFNICMAFLRMTLGKIVKKKILSEQKNSPLKKSGCGVGWLATPLTFLTKQTE